jgi:excisionase family DNA binding protein
VNYQTERLLTAAETGQFLGLRLGTIRKMTSEGRLPVVRPTGTRCVRYRLSDLEALVRSRSIPVGGGNPQQPKDAKYVK